MLFKQAAESTLKTESPQNPNQNSTTADDMKPVLRAGHHFIVVSEGKVVLDHLFGGKPSPTRNPQPALPERPDQPRVTAPATTSTAVKATEQDSGATFGSQKRSAGAISVSSVGIQVKNNFIYILIDAKVRLGVIEMSFEGFGVGITLSKITKPLELLPDDFDVVISGLGVMYDVPPIMIAGGFKKESTPTYESFMGGLVVTIPPYSITAVGAYRRTFSPDFKSVFLFGRLDGPLFTIGFAEVSGVAISFGYNYSIRSPRGNDVEFFPLLAKQDPTSNNPMDMIIGNSPSSFSSWLTAKQDSYFFSIGMKADAMQTITLEVALIFSIGVGSFKIDMVGRGTIALPPAKTKGMKPPISYLYAELGIVATLDIAGSLIIEAQLSQNSYVLSPFCHLKGGFALCYWFGNSPFAGDFVFSLGGYHPAYKPPKYWPVPPRVGIAWEISSVLKVGGEAFFAITPNAAMAGGRLFARFRAGPIFADFEAWAQFLINFTPKLFFMAEIGIRVNVGVRIDIGIITIKISGTVGADLYLEGPPIGGYVNVRILFVKFKIYFGDSGKQKPIPFEEWLGAVRKPGLTGAPDSGNANSPASSPDIIVVALSAGAATEAISKASQDTGYRWAVRAASFRFRVESKMPVGDATIDSDLSTPIDSIEKRTEDKDTKIYARLTQSLTPLHSELTVKVIRPEDADRDTGNKWRILPIEKRLPAALWGKCKLLPDEWFIRSH